MAALAYLLNLGFVAKLSGKRVRVSPASKLNDQVRAYIKNHRLGYGKRPHRASGLCHRVRLFRSARPEIQP